MHNRQTQSNKAFTLIELLVVVAINRDSDQYYRAGGGQGSRSGQTNTVPGESAFHRSGNSGIHERVS